MMMAMRRIWKFGPLIDAVNNIDIPERSEFLHVGMQDEKIFIWFLVNPESPKILRRFTVYGTGWPVENDGSIHLGTVQSKVGYVWHIFGHHEFGIVL